MKKITSLLAVLLVLTLCAAPAQAATPYRTFTIGSDGRLVETQTAYEPIRSMTRFGDETLKTPQDIRIGPDGYLYIADNGNNRVLVVTKQGDYVTSIGSKKQLKSAMGVYVDESLNVYVADEKGRSVVVFSQTAPGDYSAYEMVREYGKPTHPLFGDKSPYKPSKLVLDKRGNLYIASTGSTNGIIQISPNGDGEFLGYYGANTSSVSFVMAIMKQILSDEQLSMMGSIVPTSVQNLCIDEKGMVYTVSQSSDQSSLRRLNVAGRNTLTPEYWYDATCAVATHPSGSIFTANKNGYILEYSSEGDMLFDFGVSGDQRVGTFQSVTGLVVDDDYTLYVLDERLNNVQVLAATEFTKLVHHAFALFKDGKYKESKEPWSEVLRMNSMFAYASVGLGEALYRENNFEEALQAFRNGNNKIGYSNAFWEMRSNAMHDSMNPVLIAAAVIIVAWQALKRLNKRFHFLDPIGKAWRWFCNLKYVSHTGYCLQMLKNPFDTCYGIKRENRASWLGAIIVLCIFFVEYVLGKYYSGFLFRSMPDGVYELLNDVVMVFGVFLLLTICCYLVCTIREGEARFKDLFIGFAYALAPMLIFQPITLALTNVLTYNEQFFITLINFVSIGWTVLLIVLTLMYMNDYSFKQTLVTIVITAFTVLIMVCLMFVIYVLVSQLIDFVVSVYGEVVYRFVKKM